MPDRLEAELRGLSEIIEWPEADLTTAIRVGIDRRQEERPAPGRGLPRWAAAVAVVVVVVALAVTPAGRRAVADLLGVVGIDIELGGEPSVPVGSDLDLGVEIDATRMPDDLGFQALVPDLGQPDAAYVSAGTPPILSMVWEPNGNLAEVADTGVAVLFSQFAGQVGDEVLTKEMGSDTEILVVSVQGVEGRWIEGAPHVVVDETGVDEYARLAANVLAWHRGGVTYRLELAGSLETARDIAASLHPFSGP